jgi:hypothetical protein
MQPGGPVQQPYPRVDFIFLVRDYEFGYCWVLLISILWSYLKFLYPALNLKEEIEKIYNLVILKTYPKK